MYICMFLNNNKKNWKKQNKKNPEPQFCFLMTTKTVRWNIAVLSNRFGYGPDDLLHPTFD